MEIKAAEPIPGVEVPSDEGLKSLSGMISRQLSLEEQIKSLTNSLNSLTEQHRRISEDIIPQEMTSLGLAELTLKDGGKVTIKSVYSASISKAKNAKAMAWLREHGHDGLIKSLVISQFGRGEEQNRAELMELLVAKHIQAESKESVHAHTLKAWVKECIEKAIDIPQDLFGVYVGKKAEIKTPK